MTEMQDKDCGKLPSLRWEDFEVGDVFQAPWGRTITEAHVLAFSGVTGDFQHLHVDELYAGRSGFGTRIAHGPLTAVTGLGMQVYTQVWRNAMAFLEERHEYLLPVLIGDTLYSAMEVLEVRETRRSDRGVVIFRNDISNQREALVCRSHYSMMIRRRSMQG
jgi:3-hydroxybutyryl-CoA dehydratase